jgi:hypothetical protein
MDAFIQGLVDVVDRTQAELASSWIQPPVGTVTREHLIQRLSEQKSGLGALDIAAGSDQSFVAVAFLELEPHMSELSGLPAMPAVTPAADHTHVPGLSHSAIGVHQAIISFALLSIKELLTEQTPLRLSGEYVWRQTASSRC